ncbi:MAG TPA: site-2 protease family protein [Patescibacteria group bacterium]|nr:site-2 protease family protein [Patescibacteria group bacterium]
MQTKDLLKGMVLGGGAALLAFIGLEHTSFLDHTKPQNSFEKMVLFVSLPLGYFAATMIHELGHLLTALAQGFRFQMFVVTFLGLKNENGKVKTYFNTDMNLFGGIAAAVPAAPHPSNKRKFAYVLLGGPLASIVLGIALMTGATFIYSPLRIFIGISGLLSCALFLATTIPSRSGGFFTDRARFQRLLKKDKTSEIEEALLEITALRNSGIAIKDLDRAKLQLIQSDSEPMVQFIGHAYAHAQLIEIGEEETARLHKAYMDELSTKLPSYMVKMLQNL